MEPATNVFLSEFTTRRGRLIGNPFRAAVGGFFVNVFFVCLISWFGHHAHTNSMQLSVSIFQSRIHGGFERQWWQSFSKFWPVVANCFTNRLVTDTFADSGRPPFQEALYLRGL